MRPLTIKWGNKIRRMGLDYVTRCLQLRRKDLSLARTEIVQNQMNITCSVTKTVENIMRVNGIQKWKCMPNEI